MAEIINLKTKRKQKNREDKAQKAHENRILHGRTKAEKQRDSVNAEKTVAFLDGHKKSDRD